MNGPDAARAYGATFLPSVDELRRPLAELGEGLAGQFAELQVRPSHERCDRLCLNLEGALRHVRAFREALLREGEGDAT